MYLALFYSFLTPWLPGSDMQVIPILIVRCLPMLRIRDILLRMRIREAQKHTDPTNPDPEQW
jgi:hypothetical protein